MIKKVNLDQAGEPSNYNDYRRKMEVVDESNSQHPALQGASTLRGLWE